MLEALIVRMERNDGLEEDENPEAHSSVGLSAGLPAMIAHFVASHYDKQGVQEVLGVDPEQVVYMW